MRNQFRRFIVPLFGALLLVNALGASAWAETPDVGDSLATAGIVAGGTTSVAGSLSAVSDVDLYRICITSPADFGVAVTGTAGDGQLFLFDENGLGVAWNDDKGNSQYAPAFPVGNAVLASLLTGTYYLGLSNYNVDPYSATGLIFIDSNTSAADPVKPADGPGGLDPLTFWAPSFYTSFPISNYTITMTGAAGCTPIQATLSPVHAWVGLKNNDDQGTRFDLRAQVWQNGSVVASGLTRCVNGVTRNPSLAKEVVVGWDPSSPVPAGEFALVLSTRIGTNPDETKCTPGPGGSHSSAVGLRVYYDSTDRPSRFDMTLGSSSTDVYLHSNGGACTSAPSVGATNLSFDEVAPTAAAKCKDSGGVNFAGGNPWKVIGSWVGTP